MTQASHRADPTAAEPRRDEYLRKRRDYWEAYARRIERWEPARRHYRNRLAQVYRFLIPPGMRVLDLGCAQGDLLAALRPAYGVGVDFSPAMLARARERHPQLIFIERDVHTLDLGERFDYIVCSDLVNDLWDVQQVFHVAARHSHPGTRLLINSYNRMWEVPRKLAEFLRVAKPQLSQNWLTVEDISHLLYLADFEPLRSFPEVLWPFRTPGLDLLCNRFLVKVAPLRWLSMTNFVVARPRPSGAASSAVARESRVSVVVPARNEAGNIPRILDSMPQMGGGTEVIFVEGHSTDGTYAAIEREIARHPGLDARVLRQSGKGKGDAVRLGFAHATGDLLMILDADLTVPPEDLPRFYEAWRSGKGEFVNGVRLVYPMYEGAMRFFNLVGNKFFSLAFSWLLGQSVKDTLCGTKALSRRHYDIIAANRSHFGTLDPFGDFDLLFGAARFALKIVDLPVRYRERTYGQTNIQRWRHGWILLRMLALALFRLKFV